MGQLKRYNIDGILTISIENDTERPFVRWLTTSSMELGFFETSSTSDADIEVCFNRFEPDLRNCMKIESGLWAREGYMFFRQRGKFASLDVEISHDVTDQIKVRINGNFLGRHLSFGRIVEPLVSMLAESRNAAKIHAAGIAKDGTGMLIAGLGGSGKTSIAMELVKRGWHFLGDDTVMIKDHVILPFPKWIHVFRYRLDTKTAFDESLGFGDRAKTYLGWLASEATHGYARVFTFLNPSDPRLSFSIAPRANLKTVVILEPGGDSLSLTPVSFEEAATRMTANDMCELTHIMYPLFVYRFFNQRTPLFPNWARHEGLLANALSHARCYVAKYPKPNTDLVDMLESAGWNDALSPSALDLNPRT